MADNSLNELASFLVVAREQNFTRAAKNLGVSQSALSQTVRNLEDQLGIKLLHRTTRRVSPTDAGEQLINSIGPKIEEIQQQLALLSELGDKPTGTIRLTATEYSAEAVLWPAVDKLVKMYPKIKVEIITDYGLTDIVKDRFDAGVRPRETIAKDMVAIRIGPRTRMVVAGHPDYLNSRSIPTHPKELTEHNCINLRLPGHGGTYAWEFEKDGTSLNVHVDGQLTYNSGLLILKSALAGKGLVYLPEGQLQPYLQTGELISVLDDWSESLEGYHLYYPSHRQPTRALTLLIELLKYDGDIV